MGFTAVKVSKKKTPKQIIYPINSNLKTVTLGCGLLAVISELLSLDLHTARHQDTKSNKYTPTSISLLHNCSTYLQERKKNTLSFSLTHNSHQYHLSCDVT